MTTENISPEIAKIRQEIMADPMNLIYTKQGIEPIFAAPPSAKILIASQAPGLKAQTANKSFYDPSGDRLRQWLGVDETLFYNSGKFAILPMDYYFPGKGKSGDLPPRKGFADKWNQRILQTMPELELIILIGGYAQKYYLGSTRKKTLMETVKHYQEYLPKYFPLVHPSPLNIGWRRKNPWFEDEIVPILQTKVQTLLNQK